jgi:hypothetical protein
MNDSLGASLNQRHGPMDGRRQLRAVGNGQFGLRLPGGGGEHIFTRFVGGAGSRSATVAGDLHELPGRRLHAQFVDRVIRRDTAQALQYAPASSIDTRRLLVHRRKCAHGGGEIGQPQLGKHEQEFLAPAVPRQRRLPHASFPKRDGEHTNAAPQGALEPALLANGQKHIGFRIATESVSSTLKLRPAGPPIADLTIEHYVVAATRGHLRLLANWREPDVRQPPLVTGDAGHRAFPDARVVRPAARHVAHVQGER